MGQAGLQKGRSLSQLPFGKYTTWIDRRQANPCPPRRRELQSKPRCVLIPPMHLRLFLALPLLALGIPALGADEFLVYFGTHTSGESRGIYAYRFDAGSDKLASLGLAAETENPFFLAIHPNGRYLYSVSEPSGDGGETAGAVSAFAIDKNTGKLTLLNKGSARGDGPCHLNVDQTGKCSLWPTTTAAGFSSPPTRTPATSSCSETTRQPAA